MKYIMGMTEEQYNHIAQCVEVAHRIACGQIESLNEILPIKVDDATIREIKHQAFPELGLNQSYGWNGGYKNNSHGEDFRKAFDLFQAMGYQIYREMVHQRTIAMGVYNVYSSPTLTTYKAQQPIIEVIKKE